MEPYESLLQIYSIRKKCHSQHADVCEVDEHEGTDATFHRLYIQDVGAQMEKFDTEYVKGFKNTTENITPILKDSNCDSVVFLNGNDGKLHLIFAELKSKQTADNLRKAFSQVIFTFFKYHQLLSICENYDLSNISMDFVLACHAAEVNDEAEVYSDVQNEQILFESSEAKSFVTDILPDLLKKRFCSLKLKDLKGLGTMPFRTDLLEKSISLHLATSALPSDDTATIILDY